MKLFISYSHKNKDEKEELETYLNNYKRHIDSFDYWSDKDLKAGNKIKDEIFKSIDQSNAAILLVSAHFINSDFINSEEIPRILKAKRENENYQIFPFIISHCNWSLLDWLPEYLARPYDGRPYKSLKNESEKEEAMDSFTKEIYSLSNSAISKADLYSKASIETIESSTNHILEELYELFKKFEPLNTIPQVQLSSLYPFNQQKKQVYRYEPFTLQTHNRSIYNLLNELEIKDSKFTISDSLKNELLKTNSLSQIEEKTNYILHKLASSLVMNIEAFQDIEDAKRKLINQGYNDYYVWKFPSVEDNSKIFKIDYNFHKKDCDCQLCLFYDLKIDKLIERFEILKNNPTEFTLENGFTQFKIGYENYNKAYEIFKYIYLANTNSIEVFVAAYNLKNILPYVRSGFYRAPNRFEAIEFIESIDLNAILDKLDIEDSVKNILIEIKEERIVNKVRNKVDEIYFEILELKRLFDSGGHSSGRNFAWDLHTQLAILYAFYDNNYLIGLNYFEANKTIERIFECMLILSTLEAYDGRLEAFNSFQLINFVLHLNSSSFKKIIKRNNIKCINIEKSGHSEFLNTTNNLLVSIINLYKKGQGVILPDNFDFSDNISRIVSNVFMLLPYVEIKKNKFISSFLDSLIEFISVFGSSSYYNSIESICSFVESHGILFSKIQLEKILVISTEKIRHDDSRFLNSVYRHLRKTKRNLKFSLALYEKIELSIGSENLLKHSEVYTFLFKVSNKQVQNLISRKFENELKKETTIIRAEILTNLIFAKILPVEKYIDKLTSLIIKAEIKESYRDIPFFGPQKNYTFLNYVSLLYYYNINRRQILESIPKTVKISPYCKWLLSFDFEEYNYEDFKMDWLLFTGLETYYMAFAKEKRIMDLVKTELKKNKKGKLSEVFMRYWF